MKDKRGQGEGIMEVLDKLEELLGACTRVPFTGRLILDEEQIYEVLDEIRAALPEELRQARQVIRERDRILEHASAEAGLMMKEAQMRVERLTDETSITSQARAHAEEIVENSRKVSAELNQRAREYADDTMGYVQQQLENVLAEISEGRRQLRDLQQEREEQDIS